jgi:hypothetical protein
MRYSERTVSKQIQYRLLRRTLVKLMLFGVVLSILISYDDS